MCARPLEARPDPPVTDAGQQQESAPLRKDRSIVPSMAGTVWLHVGCPKTGTGFLQGVVWSNREALRQQGLLLPGTSAHDHYQASVYVRGAHARRARADHIEETWRRLADEVHRTDRDVLITHEVFAHASAQQAKSTIDALGGAETHVIITARDLARQIPA